MKFVNGYARGFKKILTNKSAALVLVAYQLRNWEAAITNAFLSDYMNVYQNDQTADGKLNKTLYPTLVAGATLTGPLFANFITLILIGCLGSDNPMAIPYVCMMRCMICVPCVYLIFILNKTFWFSIGGLFGRQLLSLGYTAPSILMLQNVVDEDVKSLSYGLFSLLQDIDNSVATFTAGSLKSKLKLDSHEKPAEFGQMLGYNGIITTMLAIIFYYLAGQQERLKQSKLIDKGEITIQQVRANAII